MNVAEHDRGPGFQYSIGFQRTFDHPEVVIFGQRAEVMHGMLTAIADELRAGRRYDDGRPVSDLLDGYVCLFRPVPPARVPDFFGRALRYYGHEPFAALQCIWPDLSGHYPWDPAASVELRWYQPVLDPGA